MATFRLFMLSVISSTLIGLTAKASLLDYPKFVPNCETASLTLNEVLSMPTVKTVPAFNATAGENLLTPDLARVVEALFTEFDSHTRSYIRDPQTIEALGRLQFQVKAELIEVDPVAESFNYDDAHKNPTREFRLAVLAFDGNPIAVVKIDRTRLFPGELTGDTRVVAVEKTPEQIFKLRNFLLAIYGKTDKWIQLEAPPYNFASFENGAMGIEILTPKLLGAPGVRRLLQLSNAVDPTSFSTESGTEVYVAVEESGSYLLRLRFRVSRQPDIEQVLRFGAADAEKLLARVEATLRSEIIESRERLVSHKLASLAPDGVMREDSWLGIGRTDDDGMIPQVSMPDRPETLELMHDQLKEEWERLNIKRYTPREKVEGRDPEGVIYLQGYQDVRRIFVARVLYLLREALGLKSPE